MNSLLGHRLSVDVINATRHEAAADVGDMLVGLVGHDAEFLPIQVGGSGQQEEQSVNNSFVGLATNSPTCKSRATRGSSALQESARMASLGSQAEPDPSQGMRIALLETQSQSIGQEAATVGAQNPRLRPPVPLGLLGVPTEFTTLVIRNIPTKYNQAMLLMEFQPDGAFDFFFLPYSFQHGRILGHALANFRSYQMALAFQEKWHRHFLTDHGCTKHLDVVAADVQGIEGNLAQLSFASLSRLHRANMLPVFFSESGLRLDTIAKLELLGIAL